MSRSRAQEVVLPCLTGALITCRCRCHPVQQSISAYPKIRVKSKVGTDMKSVMAEGTASSVSRTSKDSTLQHRDYPATAHINIPMCAQRHWGTQTKHARTRHKEMQFGRRLMMLASTPPLHWCTSRNNPSSPLCITSKGHLQNLCT